VEKDLLLVHQQLMEQLVYQDIIYQLNGLPVHHVLHQLLLVLHLQPFNHVYLHIIQLLLVDLMLLVQHVQQVEILLIVIIQHMLLVVNQVIILLMDNVKHVHLILKIVLEIL